MDSFLRDTIELRGRPRRSLLLTAEQDVALSQILPVSFIGFVRAYSIGNYYDRRLHYCDPREYASVLPFVVGADPDFSHSDCFVVGYSAFGRLLCWSKRHHAFQIDLTALQLMSSKLASSPLITRPGAPTSSQA